MNEILLYTVILTEVIGSVLACSTAEQRTVVYRAVYNTYMDTYTQTDLPRAERAAQTQTCLELQNLESPSRV